MTKLLSGSTRNDFLKSTKGDTLRVVGGKYEGHLALFQEVKKCYIGVRVRKVKGLGPANHLAKSTDYSHTNLAPHNLYPAPELSDKERVARAFWERRTRQDIHPPTPLHLAIGPQIKQAFSDLHSIVARLSLDNSDEKFIKYTLDLALLIKGDLVRLAEGEATIVQTIVAVGKGDGSPKHTGLDDSQDYAN
jgi:hypothetical protein